MRTYLFEGIKCVIHDSLLVRARPCASSGFELWRRLHSEWEGSAPQLKHAVPAAGPPLALMGGEANDPDEADESLDDSDCWE